MMLSTPSEPAAPFRGWTEAAQRFLKGLEMDNSKSYFEAHRELYAHTVRGPMEARWQSSSRSSVLARSPG
jgi:uncharacterized protein (DUF2461 family)